MPFETITIERIYNASVDQSNAINAAADRECNQRLMADFYADCLRADAIGRRDGTGRVNWIAVNNAILKRWPKGLSRIKNAAWKVLAKR